MVTTGLYWTGVMGVYQCHMSPALLISADASVTLIIFKICNNTNRLIIIRFMMVLQSLWATWCSAVELEL